jgi:hypothetical protein
LKLKLEKLDLLRLDIFKLPLLTNSLRIVLLLFPETYLDRQISQDSHPEE